MQKEITGLLLAIHHRRSRSLLHQRENTLSGSEVPSLLPSPHSKPCGSQSKTKTKLVHPSSTENASNFLFSLYIFVFKPQNPDRCEYNVFYFLNFVVSWFVCIPKEWKVVSAVYYSAYEPQVLCIGIRFRFENKVIYVNEDIYRKIENCIWHYFI